MMLLEIACFSLLSFAALYSAQINESVNQELVEMRLKDIIDSFETKHYHFMQSHRVRMINQVIIDRLNTDFRTMIQQVDVHQ